MLRAGSLLGSSFSPTELAAITARPVTELVPALETAMVAGVLDEDGTRLRFRHDLIRDAIYADLTPSLRLGLHREAATRLADIGASATRVADQFERGAAPGDPEAIEWLVKAAREAVSSSPETAADLLQSASELMTAADSRRDPLLAERADSLMLAGKVADVVDACQSLLAREHDVSVDAPARVRLGAALLVNGRPAEALRELDMVSSSCSQHRSRAAGLPGRSESGKPLARGLRQCSDVCRTGTPGGGARRRPSHCRGNARDSVGGRVHARPAGGGAQAERRSGLTR